MAPESGTNDPDVGVAEDPAVAPSGRNAEASRYGAVEALLHSVPYEFEFFQAVRLFERMLPGAPVGGFAAPSKEVLRFRAHASFPFPASEIQRIEWPEAGTPAVVINFMGLFGPSGLLPLYYTSLILERIRQKDHVLKNFLDIFHHRMVSLFYQAWQKYRFTIAYERGERDRFSHHLMDLVGQGTRGLENRLDVRDDTLLYYSGLLSLHTHPEAALQRIIWDYFDVRVEIEQFVGAWHRLEESNLCHMGWESGASEELGGGAIVGDEIWDQQSGVRIKLGPLRLDQYLDFLPSGTAYQPLKALAKFVGRGEIDFQIQLILRKEDVPACELGVEPEDPPRLGWTSWAKTQPLRTDARDTIFAI
jgi:type VI secretion system protein ImpH